MAIDKAFLPETELNPAGRRPNPMLDSSKSPSWSVQKELHNRRGNPPGFVGLRKRPPGSGGPGSLSHRQALRFSKP